MSKIQTMYEKMGISPAVYEYGELIVGHLKERFAKIDETAEYNQLKVLHAMQEERVLSLFLFLNLLKEQNLKKFII